MKSTPAKATKDRFGDKEKLVAAVKGLATAELWLDKVNPEKGLERVSNSKLLRLHRTLSRVKKDFGTRGKLIDAVLAFESRAKDTGLRSKLETYPTPRLVDLHDAAARRAKGAKKAAKPKTANAKKKRARSKKAQAKAKSGAPAAKAKK